MTVTRRIKAVEYGVSVFNIKDGAHKKIIGKLPDLKNLYITLCWSHTNPEAAGVPTWIKKQPEFGEDAHDRFALGRPKVAFDDMTYVQWEIMFEGASKQSCGLTFRNRFTDCVLATL